MRLTTYLHQIPFAALPISGEFAPIDSVGSSGSVRRDSARKLIDSDDDVEDIATPVTPQSTDAQDQPQQIFLGDCFRLRVVPSSQILEICARRPTFSLGQTTHASVIDTRNDLLFARLEGRAVTELMGTPDSHCLIGRQQATLANYETLLAPYRTSATNQALTLLESHHAESRFDDPLKSQLLLGDGEITLGHLLSPGYRLPNLQEVFLSCCETGLGTPKNLSDDFLTLAHGFLYAGARTVVSSLWAVNDYSTALFSIFYHQFRIAQDDAPTALQKAQQQLRELTGEQFRELVEKYKIKKDLQDHQRHLNPNSVGYNLIQGHLDKLETNSQPGTYPFASPYFWAAFVCQGYTTSQDAPPLLEQYLSIRKPTTARPRPRIAANVHQTRSTPASYQYRKQAKKGEPRFLQILLNSLKRLLRQIKAFVLKQVVPSKRKDRS